MFSRVAGLCLALLLTACATTQVVIPEPTEPPLVMLVSIDGFRADYLDRGITPNLSRLAGEGATGPMRPSFPSVTFPNHYTLVTGLHPDHHGIVGNNMVDAELGRFSLSAKQAVTDRRWWDQGEPIWVSAEKAGVKTATMFWPARKRTFAACVRPTGPPSIRRCRATRAWIACCNGWTCRTISGRN